MLLEMTLLLVLSFDCVMLSTSLISSYHIIIYVKRPFLPQQMTGYHPKYGHVKK